MTDNARKVFDMLGVEPGEKFKIKEYGKFIYKIDENLDIYYKPKSSWEISNMNVGWFLTGEEKIVKLSNKKKLRDLTLEEYNKWRHKYCLVDNSCCEKCLFNNVLCRANGFCWINHKELFSDKFLDQEIEIPEEEK